MNLTPLEIGRAAAIVDCEGAIMISRHGRRDRATPQWQLRMTVTNSDIRICGEMARLFGGGVYGPYQNKVKGSDPGRPDYGKPWWSWEASNHKAAAILRQMRPYLISKPEQAEIALQYAATLGKGGRRLAPEVVEKRTRLAGELKQLRLVAGGE